MPTQQNTIRPDMVLLALANDCNKYLDEEVTGRRADLRDKPISYADESRKLPAVKAYFSLATAHVLLTVLNNHSSSLWVPFTPEKTREWLHDVAVRRGDRSAQTLMGEYNFHAGRLYTTLFSEPTLREEVAPFIEATRDLAKQKKAENLAIILEAGIPSLVK